MKNSSNTDPIYTKNVNTKKVRLIVSWIIF